MKTLSQGTIERSAESLIKPRSTVRTETAAPFAASLETEDAGASPVRTSSAAPIVTDHLSVWYGSQQAVFDISLSFPARE